MNPPQADTFEATVVAELPQQLYRLETEHPQPQTVLTASLSAEARRIGVHVRTGQRVLVRRASLDPGHGVITGLASRQP